MTEHNRHVDPEAAPNLNFVLSTDTFDRLDMRAILGLLKSATDVATTAEDVLRKAGSSMSVKEWDALAMLHAYGPMRPSDLLRRTVMTGRAQTLSSVLKRLEQRGLVTRDVYPDDPRGVVVTITDEGAAAAVELYPLLVRQLIQPFTGRFSDEELQFLAALFDHR